MRNCCSSPSAYLVHKVWYLPEGFQRQITSVLSASNAKILPKDKIVHRQINGQTREHRGAKLYKICTSFTNNFHPITKKKLTKFSHLNSV